MSDRSDPADSTPPRDPRGLGSLEGDVPEWYGASPAPGEALPRFRASLSLQRTRFTAKLADASAATVDVDHASGRASLYRNNRHERTAQMPASFTLGPERIDVVASRYGMRRIHLIRADGTAERLDPAPGTPEHWRGRFAQRRPRISNALGMIAIAVLVVNLILLAPQLMEVITHLAVWPDQVPSFVSPISLPAWLNSALTVTGALAATERALTFRHHRILDVETEGLDA